MRKLVYPLLIALLVACNPTVIFLEPQPEGKKDLENFPSKLRGTYMELDDSSYFIIQENIILEKYEEDIAGPLSEVLEDEDIEIIGENLHAKELNLKFPFRRSNDSIFSHIVIWDTIIDLRKDNKLRKLGRNYFLNQPSDSLWLVFKLSFDKSGFAYLCDIDHEKEIRIWEQYSTVETEKNDEGNPMKYYLSPTRNELKKIIKLETFTDSTRYIRVPQELAR